VGLESECRLHLGGVVVHFDDVHLRRFAIAIVIGGGHVCGDRSLGGQRFFSIAGGDDLVRLHHAPQHCGEDLVGVWVARRIDDQHALAGGGLLDSQQRGAGFRTAA
jgi:hypothetical protein